MVSKALKLLLVSLTIVQTNGCFNKVLKDEFDTLDRDKNGFITEDESCYQVQSNYFGPDSGKICDKIWKAMDLNEDGKASCQETLVGALVLDETMHGEFGHQLRSIFADKPENCQEITKNEMHSLVMVDINEGNEVNVEDVYRRIDADHDGIFTCNGTLKTQVTYLDSKMIFVFVEVLVNLFMMMQGDPDVEDGVLEDFDTI